MNTTSKKILTLLGIALAMTIIWTSAAVAKQDGKFYPGLVCVDQYGPTSTRTQVKYLSNGSVVNNATKAVSVSCLIVTDVNSKKGINRVTVHYTNHHPTEKVSCAAQYRGNNPQQTLGDKRAVSNLVGQKQGALTMCGLAGKGAKGIQNGRFIMLCKIPPRSTAQIHAFSVYEYGD